MTSAVKRAVRAKRLASKPTNSSGPGRLLLFAAVSVLAGTSTLSAQTMQYRERSDGVVTLQTPGGPLQLQSEHEASISVEEVGADSLHAWYTELDVAAIDPSGAADRPDPSTILGQYFVLRRGPQGHIETLATPDFPESFAAVTDLTLQFFDFFPSIPSGGYAVGVTWTDTTTAPQGADPSTTSTGTKITSYRVVRRMVDDGGTAAWLIEADAELSFRSEGPVPEQPGLSARTTTDGTEENVFLVSVEDGQLLRRTRTGTLSGQIEYLGAAQPIVLPVERSYENLIERVAG